MQQVQCDVLVNWICFKQNYSHKFDVRYSVIGLEKVSDHHFFFLNETQFTFFLCKADQNKANNTGNVDLINIFPKKHIQQDTVYIWSFLLKSKEIWIKNAISIKWRHGIMQLIYRKQFP